MDLDMKLERCIDTFRVILHSYRNSVIAYTYTGTSTLAIPFVDGFWQRYSISLLIAVLQTSGWTKGRHSASVNALKYTQKDTFVNFFKRQCGVEGLRSWRKKHKGMAAVVFRPTEPAFRPTEPSSSHSPISMHRSGLP